VEGRAAAAAADGDVRGVSFDGPGANPKARESYSKHLTAAEAEKYETKTYLAGADGWDPTAVR
jgi:hypothetical protein